MNRKMPMAADMVGHVMTALFTGDGPAGCPYLLPVLLDMKMRIPAAKQGAMAYGLCMEALVDAGLFTEPEPWDALTAELQNAWTTIGAEWLRDLPSDSKLAELIAQGSVQVE